MASIITSEPCASTGPPIGIPDQSFDGLPAIQSNFRPRAASGSRADESRLRSGVCLPSERLHDRREQPAGRSFPMVSMCVENPSPSWNEDHVDWNLNNPVSSTAYFGWVRLDRGSRRQNQSTAVHRCRWRARHGLLRRDGLAVLLFHGVKFRYVGSLVFARHVANPA